VPGGRKGYASVRSDPEKHQARWYAFTTFLLHLSAVIIRKRTEDSHHGETEVNLVTIFVSCSRTHPSRSIEAR